MGIQERKERERESRREGILDAAQKIFFDKGLVACTVDEIAEAAELSKGTLYLYYKSKEDMYLAVTMRGMEILGGIFREVIAAGDDVVVTLHRLMKAYVGFFHSHRGFFRMMNFLQTPQLHKQVSEEMKQSSDKRTHEIWSTVVNVLKNGISEGTVTDTLEPLELTIILWSGTTSLMLRIDTQNELWKDRMHIDLERTLERSNRLFLDAILTNEGRRRLEMLLNPSSNTRHV